MSKKIISFLLLFAMILMPVTSFALSEPDIDFDKDTGELFVTNSDVLAGNNVNIIIEKKGKKYFFDSKTFNENRYSFRTILPVNIGTLNTTITSGQENILFSLDTNEDIEIINLDTDENVTFADNSLIYEIPDSLEDKLSIPITEDKINDKNLEIIIPDGFNNTITLDLMTVRDNLPKISSTSKIVSVDIPKGTSTNDDVSNMILSKFKDVTDENLKNKVEKMVNEQLSIQNLGSYIQLGGSSRITFDNYITIRFIGQGNKEAIYIENNVAKVIKKVDNDSLGEGDEYCYKDGNDLIIKTKHFTDFVTCTKKSDSGNTTIPTNDKIEITLSVDKKTIDKGYVVNPVKLKVKKHTTVWEVLKDYLNDNGIDIEHRFTAEYNSVYVESINGDGEFDHGSGSGWMYSVNGIYPNYGCSLYELQDGDVIKWRYTTNLGVDLGVAWIEEDHPKEDNLEFAFEDKNLVSSWALESMKKAFELKVLQGSYGKCNPQNLVTRAEFTKIITAILGIDINQEKVIDFPDVKNEDWFYPYVNACYKYGIVKGAISKYNPDAPITREEMAIIISRVIKSKNKANLDFKDNNEISSWAIDAVSNVYANDIMLGFNGFFNPKEEVSREVAIVVAIRCLNVERNRISN